MDVRYSDEVFEDLKPSVDWFNSRRTGLGEELEEAFYDAVAVIRGRPNAYAVDHTGLRSFRLQRFAAVVYYKTEEGLLSDAPIVVIVGILVGGRDDACLRYRG